MTMSLQTYLTMVKSELANVQLVVLGNDAADLDSMVSALAYAYLRYQQNPDLLPLAVMAIPRCDFFLRAEAVYAFKEAGIPLADLVFFDEVDLVSLVKSGADLVLVDHNSLAPRLAFLGDHVVGVLDHHRDEGQYRMSNPRLIRPVGSTTTLVALEFFKGGVTMDQALILLLCGTLLLDTVNLEPEAGRVTRDDFDVAAQLLPLCPLPQQEFFTALRQGKMQVDGFSSHDLLRKDYKDFYFGSMHCGICSVHVSVGGWFKDDPHLFSVFTAFQDQRNLDVLISMNSYADPDFSRDLVVCAKNGAECDRLYLYLQEGGLGLSPLELGDLSHDNGGCLRLFAQANSTFSRKKLQPLLADFYGK